ARAESRIWIVDRDQRLLALAGDLKKRSASDEPPDLLTRVVHPVAALVLDRPSEDFDDSLPESEIGGAVAASALQGVPARRWRQSPDSRAVILSASHPVWSGDDVVAAVVAEETTNATRSAYNRAMEQVIGLTLIAFVAGALALLLFASRISSRLVRLRDEAEAAIDSQGRVRKVLAGSSARDEIGDLSRSFSTVLARLGEYNRYLEAMAGRLSHELRTPIAVVRSSLDNLRLQLLPAEAGVYLARANDGLKRLDTILTRMSGATLAHPGKKFEIDVPSEPVWLRGAPELYGQMLDKLAANAVDFATGDEPIRIRLEPRGEDAVLTVSNRGPRLPQAMAGKLFESMVSVRSRESGAEPHLGLGLYIVRLIAEFHGGSAQALDREDGSGVVVKVLTPLDSATGT